MYDTHDIGFIFSIVILGIFATGIIVSISLRRDENNEKTPNSPSPTPTLISNYSIENSNNSSMNLRQKMSNMGYNPYINSSNTGSWSYGTYRGGNKDINL